MPLGIDCRRHLVETHTPTVGFQTLDTSILDLVDEHRPKAVSAESNGPMPEFNATFLQQNPRHCEETVGTALTASPERG